MSVCLKWLYGDAEVMCGGAVPICLRGCVKLRGESLESLNDEVIRLIGQGHSAHMKGTLACIVVLDHNVISSKSRVRCNRQERYDKSPSLLPTQF